MLETPDLTSQPQFIKLLADPFLIIFYEESDLEILSLLASLLYDMAASAVRFGEYSLASWLFGHLHGRSQKLEVPKDTQQRLLLRAFDKGLDPSIENLLTEDLTSGDTSRQQKAAQLLGSLGPASIPVLIKIIKEAGDLRVKQIAAILMKKFGEDGVQRLKRELITDNSAKARMGILGVIDTVTHDLAVELTYVLGDENPRVSRAAFRLAERINNKDMVHLLIEHARDKNLILAAASIKSLGRIKAHAAAEELVLLVESSRESERLEACARTLGQIGDPVAIEALSGLLAKKTPVLFRRKYSADVRAAAAFALSQFTDPRAGEILQSFSDDPDTRVRQVARSLTRKDGNESPPTGGN
jgi:HEAT repeat protein